MNGVDFVNEIETKLFKYRISKETFYTESGISTANMSQWRTGKFNPSQKMIDRAEAFFEKHLISKALDTSFTSVYKQKEKTPTTEGGRDFAKNDHEEDMLLLARHMAPIPDEDREALKEQFRNSIDLYLKAKGITPGG